MLCTENLTSCPAAGAATRQMYRYDPTVSQNKNRSYCRETARRFLSWNILLSHSVSLKVIRNDTVE